MLIEVIVVSPFMQNSRIIACEDTKEAIIIDPGDEAYRIIACIEKMHVTPKMIIATHAHIDHVGSVAPIQKLLNIPFFLHKDDLFWLEQLPPQALMFGFPACDIPHVDGYLNEGDQLSFGHYTGRVIHTPGHSPGGICLLVEKDIFVGDTLFAGSIGRTDLPNASHKVLIDSIQKKLWYLPEDTCVHPGHGPTTTIGEEKQFNPFAGVGCI